MQHLSQSLPEYAPHSTVYDQCRQWHLRLSTTTTVFIVRLLLCAIFIFKNHKKLISICITLYLEATSCFIPSTKSYSFSFTLFSFHPHHHSRHPLLILFSTPDSNPPSFPQILPTTDSTVSPHPSDSLHRLQTGQQFSVSLSISSVCT